MNPEPNVSQEKADREMQRQQIAELLTTHPLLEIEPETLRKITPHYQQRISECRRSGMRIENVPRFLALENGRLKRLDGAYRFVPYEPLGRDAGTFQAAGWSTKHGRPFEAGFKLTP